MSEPAGGRLSRPSRALLVVTGLLAALALATVLWPASVSSPESRAPELLGHRGARGLFPENTLAGIERTLALGVTRLELDLVVTRDGALVLHHDLGLQPEHTRGPDGAWVTAATPLRQLTLAELTGFDVGRLRPGGKLARRFPEQQAVDGERIPTLEQAVALAERQSGGKILYALEMKRSPAEPALAPDVAEAAALLAGELERLGLAGRANVLSFDWDFLAAFGKAAPDVPRVYLTSEQPRFDTVLRGQASAWLGGRDLSAHEGSLSRLIKAEGGRLWSPDYRDLRPVDLEEAHALDLAVVVWTVNEPDAMASLLALGVDGIVTDYPDRLRPVLEEAGLPLPPAYPPLD